ncbi:N-acetylneuraminic acid mutarotase [Bradyrhizobium sp. USDA 4341]
MRLQNGELADTRSFALTTGNCELRNRIVACTGKANYPSTIDKGSESREMQSYINRETGEYNFLMETTSYTGRNGTGKKTGAMKYYRSGICRAISKPIF